MVANKFNNKYFFYKKIFDKIIDNCICVSEKIYDVKM